MTASFRNTIFATINRVTFQRKITASFIAIIFMVAAISLLSSHYTNRFIKSAWWVEHTLTVLNEAEKTLSFARDIEESQRDFIITGDARYLPRFDSAKDNIHNHLQALKNLTADNPSQQVKIDALVKLVERQISFSMGNIQRRKESPFEAARLGELSQQDNLLAEKTRNEIELIKKEEHSLFKLRQKSNEKTDSDFKTFFYCLAASILLILVSALFLIRYYLVSHRKAQKNLKNSLKEITDYKYAIDESSIVAITDQKGIIRHANDNFCKISKYSREDLIGQDHRIINSGYHSKEFIQSLWVTIANGKIWKGELKNRAKDGSIYWVDTTIVPFLNEYRKPYQYIAIRADITNRKFSEEQLIVTQKRYANTLENMLEGIAIIGSDYTYLYVNEAYEKQARFTRDRLLGHTIMELFPGIEETNIFTHIERCVREKISVKFENEYRFADNVSAWFEMSFQPVPEGIVIHSVDITERRKFREQQALMASIVDSSNDAIVSMDLDGITTSWNRGAKKTFGYSRDEVVGRHISMLIPAHLRGEEAVIAKKMKNGEAVHHYETERLKKDGTVILVSLTVSPIKNSSGVTTGASAILRDISEERRFQEQQALMVSIVGSSDDAIISKDMNGIITSWNYGAEKHFGYVAAEVVGNHISILIPAHLISEEAFIMGKIKNDEVVDHYETERIKKDGTVMFVSLTISPIKNSAGLIIGASKILRDVTERKNADQKILTLHEELMRSEKRFRALIENNADIVAISDEHFTPLYYSPASLKITGWRKEDIDMINPVDRIHPEDIASLKSAIVKVKSKPGVPFPVIFRTRHSNGSYVSLEGVVTNMLQNKSIRGIVFNLRDVTEARIAENKIRQSERIYKTIASGIPGSVICLVDEDYRYTLVEGDMLDKLGYSKENLLGNKMQDVVPPERFKEILPSLQRVFAGEVFTTDDRVGEFHILTRYVPLKNENGTVSMAMLVAIDVTELKKAELHILELNAGLEQKVMERTVQLKLANYELKSSLVSLKESEEKFSKIFETSPVGISIHLVRTGEVIDANYNFLQISGFTYGELINNNFVNLKMIGADDQERITDELLKNGKIKEKEISMCNKQGENFPVLLSTDRFTVGVTEYAINIIADISERKKAEEQLLAANKELEAFSYSVSHDLRAPLRAVNGYARIVFEDYNHCLDEEGKSLLQVIKQSAKRMGELIDDLLEFSRLGRKDISRSMIDMDLMVKNVLLELDQTTDHRAVVEVKKLYPIEGDYGLMSHVITNLVSNAVKYSSKNENPLIKITARKEHNEVIFSIQDNGVGFDMKYVHKLFGVFQRLHSDEEFDGTGVGLAIVQRIINKHGGRVWAEGKIDEGSTFFFTIPEIRKN